MAFVTLSFHVKFVHSICCYMYFAMFVNGLTAVIRIIRRIKAEIN